ncbi:hypothetical protein OG552_10990 [Streptomyces sp. NBC_01476]|uniref:hypothetical protein n=1 Tax=Streptomyces sp. NBC_01476 TaxID=2903881 RepID=UPI002E375AFB|nr:hypothetical protein [Streptomyces sp. NBC_01476]
MEDEHSGVEAGDRSYGADGYEAADEREWHEDDETDGRRRNFAPLLLFAVPAVVILVLLGLLFGDDLFGADHPFGDSRACAGSDTPLVPALQSQGIGLPAVVKGLHYATHEENTQAPDGVRFTAFFTSTRQAMEDYLRQQRLVAPDQAGDPRTDAYGNSLDGGDIGVPQAQCGTGQITGDFASIPKSLNGSEQLTVSVERTALGIDARPRVLITISG